MVRVLCCRRTEEGSARPKTTPLPWVKLSVVCSLVFVCSFGKDHVINNNRFSYSCDERDYMLYAFLPFMVHDFFPELSSNELGHKAGFLAGAYYIGKFVSNPIWGWLSDILGRRPVLLLGVCGTVLSELLFGFSLNFGWAIAARLMWGLLNANMYGGVKTYVTEICDDSNQASAFAKLYAATGAGRLMGPVVGGFLARSASKYETTQVSFFCMFPYELPCLVGAALGILAFIAGCIFLAEPKKSHEIGTDKGSVNSHSNSVTSDCTETDPLIQNLSPRLNGTSHADLYGSSAVSVEVEQRGGCCMSCVTWCTHCKGECTPRKTKSFVVSKSKSGITKLKEMVTVLRDRRVFLSIILYGMLSFVSNLGVVLFPLLMVTDYAHGGYHMDDNEIGTLMMVAAVCESFWQLLVFPLIVKCLGYRWTFRSGLVLLIVVCVVLPFSNRITGPIPQVSLLNATQSSSGSGSGVGFQNITYYDYCGNDLSSEVVVNENSVKRIPLKVWVVVAIILSFMAISRNTSFAALAVLIGNATVPSTRGTVNGLGESLNGLVSAVGPVMGTPLFAWSESNGLSWPLNYHFVLDVLAVSALLAAVASLFLPKTIEKKRDTLEIIQQ